MSEPVALPHDQIDTLLLRFNYGASSDTLALTASAAVSALCDALDACRAERDAALSRPAPQLTAAEQMTISEARSLATWAGSELDLIAIIDRLVPADPDGAA